VCGLLTGCRSTLSLGLLNTFIIEESLNNRLGACKFLLSMNVLVREAWQGAGGRGKEAPHQFIFPSLVVTSQVMPCSWTTHQSYPVATLCYTAAPASSIQRHLTPSPPLPRNPLFNFPLPLNNTLILPKQPRLSPNIPQSQQHARFRSLVLPTQKKPPSVKVLPKTSILHNLS